MGTVEADVIIVGAGFGGCYALHKMRQRGYSAKILEAGSDFGGVWHFNRYPGARVDSPYPYYQLTMPEIFSDYAFTTRYPTSKELREYFSYVADKLDLRKDALFNQRVVEAKYNSTTRTWHMLSDTGLTATCRIAIFAAGSTHKQYTPPFSNLDKYKGQVIHSGAWPNDFDPTGKNVALIGQGSSGVQIVQEIAKQDCNVTVFVRNPSPCMPMGEKLSYSKEEVAADKAANYVDNFYKAKFGPTIGYPYDRLPASFYDETPAQRETQYDKLWEAGGLLITSTGYAEIWSDKAANAEMYNYWLKKTRPRMKDSAKRDVLVPLEQKVWLGAKRPVIEIDYYETMDRPNVSLVDLKTTPIKEFTEEGTVVTEATADKLHKFDIVIFATGYDSCTGGLLDMNITDKNGKTLRQKWETGIRTFLGLMVPDMPNAFFLYGPQAPTALTNGPPFIEVEVEWVVDMLDKMDKDHVSSVAPKDARANEWRELNLQYFNFSLSRETPSWWDGSNIPGKVVEPLSWFGGQPSWRDACYEALEDWSAWVTED